MAELRLQPESKRMLTEWWESTKPKEGDQQLVCEVLRTIINGTWSDRWYSERDIADDQPDLPVVMIWPRKTLVVQVCFWLEKDPPELQLINIFDTDDLPDEG
ncbi:hypothetical protein ACSDR0_48960 [Streptosporangium sp. G11]|uniref:hypothetical protein n=1 Tax=Streptosporangium sp. G11 TaxID=3436926 RepID=UPI003EB722DE